MGGERAAGCARRCLEVLRCDGSDGEDAVAVRYDVPTPAGSQAEMTNRVLGAKHGLGSSMEKAAVRLVSTLEWIASVGYSFEGDGDGDYNDCFLLIHTLVVLRAWFDQHCMHHLSEYTLIQLQLLCECAGIYSKFL